MKTNLTPAQVIGIFHDAEFFGLMSAQRSTYRDPNAENADVPLWIVTAHTMGHCSVAVTLSQMQAVKRSLKADFVSVCGDSFEDYYRLEFQIR